MPKYDYRCKECGKTFEVQMHFGERLPVECDCGSRAERVILQLSAINVYWKDARSSSDASLPSYLPPVKNKAVEA